MQTVNIHHAKTHLSKLVEQAANGEPFVIAKAGKPMVKVVPIDQPEQKPVQRFGFLKGRFASGEFRMPADFKAFMREEIEEMFYGDGDRPTDAGDR